MNTEVLRRPLILSPRASAPPGRLIFAVGDVQGCYDLLTAMLEAIVADLAAQPEGEMPLLVFCGGYLDSGPEPAAVLAALVWLSRHAPAEVCVLLGSHERALLEFIDRPETLSAWGAGGGYAVLRALGVDMPEAADVDARMHAATRDALLDRLPASHLALLRSAPTHLRCGDYAFAHDVDAYRAKVVVHGNGDGSASPQEESGRIGIDTAPHRTGVLTALRLVGETVEVLQAHGGLDLADAAEQPRQADVVTMRDALLRLRPNY